jgi:hypothetical protein
VIRPSLRYSASLLPAVMFCGSLLAAQQHEPATATASAVPALVEEAAKYQLEDFHHTTWGLRYRVHRIDAKEDSVRDLIESADGNIARTIVHKGQPLTPEEDSAEEERLREMTAADVLKHRRGAETSDKFGTELISALPHAMNYTLTQGQPQIAHLERPQIVLDYAPNPAYKPSTTAQALLSGIAGRIWIDAETHHLLRIEVNITKNINLMMGILARVYEGGKVSYEQRAVGGGHYAYTNIEMDVKLRELMVKVVPYHSTLTASNITLLTPPPSFKEAVNDLLTNQAPLKP